jgi:hypothetical protein
MSAPGIRHRWPIYTYWGDPRFGNPAGGVYGLPFDGSKESGEEIVEMLGAIVQDWEIRKLTAGYAGLWILLKTGTVLRCAHQEYVLGDRRVIDGGFLNAHYNKQEPDAAPAGDA